ncbi:MAG: hypothetical protein ACE5JP_07545 [Candidatus Bipolaricaulia bacterium]
MGNTLEEIINIGIGASAMIRDRLLKEIEAFMEEKEFTEGEQQAFRERLLERADEERTRLRKVLGERTEVLLQDLGFVRAERLEALQIRVEELEQKITRVERQKKSSG